VIGDCAGWCGWCEGQCFVERVLPADAKQQAGERVLMRTCSAGMQSDWLVSGHDYRTAHKVVEP